MRTLLFSFTILASIYANGQFVNGTFQDAFVSDCSAGPSWNIPNDLSNLPERTETFQPGNAWVDMTPCGAFGNGTWIEQTLPTIANNCYSVTFDLGSYCGWDGSDAGIYVTVDGVALGDRIYNDVFSCVAGTLGWNTFTSPVFVATSNFTTIRFTGEGRCSAISPTSGFDACTPIGAIGNPGVIAFDNVIFNSLGATTENLTFEDEFICANSTITIGEAEDGFDYIWSTGETTPTIEVDAAGTYTFEYTGACVDGSASITVLQGIEPITVSIGSDTLLCSPFSLVLPTQASNVLWSTGEVASSIDVNAYGTYWARSETECGTNVDSISISETTVPVVNINDSYTLCEGDSLEISLPGGISNIVWSNGQSDSSAFISEAGTYFLTYSSLCAQYQKSFVVIVNDCDCDIYVPNSFTANDDGLNDVWKPYLDIECEFTLKIWNRWGEKIFETSNSDLAWTGNANNGSYYVPDDVYLYTIEYRSGQVEWKTLKGTVSIIR